MTQTRKMLLLLAAATGWKDLLEATRRIAVTDAGPVTPVVGLGLALADPGPVVAALRPAGP